MDQGEPSGGRLRLPECVPVREKVILTPEQFRRLVAELSEPYSTVVVLAVFCLSGCLSKTQDVVWGRGSAAVSKESAPVSVGIRYRGSLPTVPGRLSLAGRVRVVLGVSIGEPTAWRNNDFGSARRADTRSR